MEEIGFCGMRSTDNGVVRFMRVSSRVRNLRQDARSRMTCKNVNNGSQLTFTRTFFTTMASIHKEFVILESENISSPTDTNMTKQLHASTISRRVKSQIKPREQYIENRCLLSKAKEKAFAEFIQELLEVGMTLKAHHIHKLAECLCGKKPGKSWTTRFIHKHSLFLNEHARKLTPPESRPSNQCSSLESEIDLSEYEKVKGRFREILDDVLNNEIRNHFKACCQLRAQIAVLQVQSEEFRKALNAKKKKMRSNNQLFEELRGDDDKIVPFLSLENTSEAHKLRNQMLEVEDDSEDESEDEEAKYESEEATTRKYQQQLKKIRIEEEKAVPRWKAATKVQKKKKNLVQGKVVNRIQRKEMIVERPTSLRLSKEQKVGSLSRERKQQRYNTKELK